MDIELAWLGGAAPLFGLLEAGIALLVFRGVVGLSQLGAEWRRARAVDRFAINLEPLAHAAQIVLARLRDYALGGWSDVEEIVPAFTDNVHQLEGEVVHGLPVGVIFLEAPRVI